MRKSLLAAACLMLMGSAWAKRLPPPILLPLDDGIYRFVIRENSQPNRKNIYKGGHVEAYLKVTGQKLWEKYLYKVQLDPEVERDVQDVFIQKMYLDKPNRLVLENERGEWFVLDRRTGNPVQMDHFKPEGDSRPPGEAEPDQVEPVLQGDFLIQTEGEVSYGRQKVRAYDVPTGRLLWEKKISVPRSPGGGRSHVFFMLLNPNDELEINLDDGSEYRLDAKTGKTLKTTENH